MKLCYSCFKQFSDSLNVCPHCGKPEITKPEEPIYLSPGTILNGRYTVGETVGVGGFGIVYKAYDPSKESVVAIKEFFMSRFMTRAEGLKNVIINRKSLEEYNYRKTRFLREARTQAKFVSHKSIVNVYDYFEENNTAYFVMEYLPGQNLKEYIKSIPGNRIEIPFAIEVANEVGKALQSIHKEGIIHKDIAPDNIFICTGKEIRIKVMDFGAAELGDETDEYVDVVMKPGYSPKEQYDKNGNIGPWSDIYSLGATMYTMLTGIVPPESTNRVKNDTLLPIQEINPMVPDYLSNVIMRAMDIDVHMRFKDMEEFLKALNQEKKVRDPKKERKWRKTRRIISVAVAFLLVLGIGSYLYVNFDKAKKEADYIEDSSISVWFPVGDDELKESNIEIVTNKFKKALGEKGVSIDVELVPIREDKYEEELLEAIEKGEEPNLFESTGLSADVLKYAIELNDIIESNRFKETVLAKEYNNYYSDNKKIPLAIDVPIAYVSVKGPAAINYTNDYFGSLSDFGNATVVVDSEVDSLIRSNFSSVNMTSKDVYHEDIFADCPVILSTTSMGDRIAGKYAGKYKYICVAPLNNPKASFTYEWSVLNSKNEKANKAALKLLELMLTDDYQTNLCNSMVPVLEKSLNTDNEWLAPVKRIYSSLIFR